MIVLTDLNDLALRVETTIAIIENQGATIPDAFALDGYDAMTTLKQAVRELGDRLEESLLTVLVERDIEWGDGRRLYAAPNKTVKSRDNNATMEALLEYAAGDVEQMVSCLASQPFKHGTIRNLLNDEARFEELFETVVTSKTKEGKAKKRVQVADDKRN